MLTPELISYLKKLEKNNNKLWFESNRSQYTQVRANFENFVAEILKKLSAIIPEYENIAAKNCLFRINRDVRFSKNKQPYKNNMSAYFNPMGKKATGAGFYVHIQPEASFIAGGIWEPASPELAKIRQEIDYNLKEFKEVLSQSSFKKTFPNGLQKNESLVRAPKGYEEDNPAIQFLKLKSFVVYKAFEDSEITDKKFIQEIIAGFKALQPLNLFLDQALH